MSVNGYNAILISTHVVQVLHEDGMSLEDAEQRMGQVSSDMQAIIGM